MKRAAFVFGIGLIGNAISNSLQRIVASRTCTLPFSWNREEQRIAQIAEILAFVEQRVLDSRLGSEIDIVWAAGKAGFGGYAEAFEAEDAAFDSVIGLVSQLRLSRQAPLLRFHLVSSAGGLFEGQRGVDAHTAPFPRRPYGEAKLRLEERTKRLQSDIITQVYRPSSVYGYAGRHGRIGLVVAILNSVLRYTTARIHARPDTLRDYVLTDDIGRFVARVIAGPVQESCVHLLASGKATSTLEIIEIIERISQRRISVQFKLAADNTDSNTFRGNAIAAGFEPTALATGIRATAYKMRNDLYVGRQLSRRPRSR